ncbi:hypothetical protein ACG83_31185 [Frankia sp. R43]|nr:hypothetical protein ACG83_31185 [Frankia sp. R43]
MGLGIRGVDHGPVQVAISARHPVDREAAPVTESPLGGAMPPGGDDDLPPPKWPTRALLWCAGADPAALVTPELRTRYAGYGLMLLMVGAVAAAVCLAFLSTVLAFHLWLLPVSLGWGAFVFLLDRMIVSEVKRTGGGFSALWRRIVRYGLRLAIALGMAYLVAEAMLMLVFAPEIRRELVSVVELHLDEARVHKRDLEVEKIDREITALNRPVADAKKRMEDAFQTWKDQNDKLTTADHNTPPGDKAAADWEVYETAKDVYEPLNDSLVAAQTRKADALKPENLPTLTQAEADAIRDDRGFTAREVALRRVLAAHPEVRQWPWVLRGVLLGADLLPLLTKLVTRRSTYDEIVERREARASWRDVEEDKERRYRDGLTRDLRHAWARVSVAMGRDRLALWLRGDSPEFSSRWIRSNGSNGANHPGGNGSNPSPGASSFGSGHSASNGQKANAGGGAPPPPPPPQ